MIGLGGKGGFRLKSHSRSTARRATRASGSLVAGTVTDGEFPNTHHDEHIVRGRVPAPLATWAWDALVHRRVAGGLCSASGMLPDLDSESGVPRREIIAFTAAVMPLLMFDRFQRHGADDGVHGLGGRLVLPRRSFWRW